MGEEEVLEGVFLNLTLGDIFGGLLTFFLLSLQIFHLDNMGLAAWL